MSRNGLRAVYRGRPPGIDNDRAHIERSLYYGFS
nr:MAG TPA: hypothetical protein [Bacteriophage sp.]